VTILIALFIATRFFFVGVLLAAWALAAMAILPVIRAMRHLADGSRLRKHRSRAIAVTTGIVLVLGGFLLLVPMPHHSHAEGVLWMPEEAMVPGNPV
jgi:putative peptide zinc metalloprotease protein